MKATSYILSVLLWLAYLYTVVVAVCVHLVPYILSWTLDMTLVLFLVLDAAILQFIAWLYNKLPHKPQSWLFKWLDSLSLF